MIAYLRARAAEWESWLGLAIMLTVAAWCAWHWQVQLHHVAEGAVAAALAALPRRAPEILECALGRLFHRSLPSLPSLPSSSPAVPASIKEFDPMSGKFEEFLAAAEAEAVKVARAAMKQWAESLPAPASQIYADFEAYEAAPSSAAGAKFIADVASTVMDLVQSLEAAKTATAPASANAQMIAAEDAAATHEATA